MTRRYLAFFVGLLLLAVSVAVAQATRDDDPYQLVVSVAPLPQGNNVWSARIVRVGGFSGTRLVATLTSDARLTCFSCAESSVTRTLSAEAFQAAIPVFDPRAFADKPALKRVKPGDQVRASRSGACSDCFVTSVFLQHRDPDGKVVTYFASWDDVTASQIPPELIKLANGIGSLVR